jgi:hypothetical protein
MLMERYLHQPKSGNLHIERMIAAHVKQTYISSGKNRQTLIQQVRDGDLIALQQNIKDREKLILTREFVGDVRLMPFYGQMQLDLGVVGIKEIFASEALQSTSDLQQVLNRLNKAAIQQAQQIVGAAVQKYISNGGDLKSLRLLKDSGKIYSVLFPDGLSIDAHDVADEARTKLEPAAIGLIKVAIRETGLRNLPGLPQPRVPDAITNLSKTGAAIWAITETAAAATQDLARAHLDAKTAFLKIVENPLLVDQIGAKPDDLRNVAELISGTRPPGEVVRDLISRGAPGPIAHIVQIQKVFAEAHANLQDKLNAYMGAADAAVNLARNVFHVDPIVVQSVSKGIAVTNTAKNVANNVMSGNFIGAATSIIGGLFGGVLGDGPDPADVRQQELLGRLDDLEKHIHEVQRGVDELKRGQENLSRQVEDVKKALVLMEKAAEKRHEEISVKLDEIYAQSLLVKALLIDQIEGELRACDDFSADADKGGRDPKTGLFKSLREQQEFLEEFGHRLYEPCITQLRKLLPNRVEGVIYFESETKAAGDALKEIQARKQVMEAAWSIVRAKPDPELFYRSLLLPAHSMFEADKKREALREGRGGRQTGVEPFTRAVLNIGDVSRICNTLVGVHYYYHLAVADDFLHWQTSEQIDPTRMRRFPRGLLINALRLVNGAIAQISLTEGDTLLPELYEFLNSDDQNKVKQGERILKHNEALQRNLALYILQRQIDTKDMLRYAVATGSSESDAIKKLIGTKLTLLRKGDLWFFRYGADTDIQLPDAAAVASGRFYVSPGLEDLLAVRSRVIGEINTYEMTDGMTATMRRNFFRALLAGVELPMEEAIVSKQPTAAAPKGQ